LIVEISIGNFLSDLHVLSPGGTEVLARNPDGNIKKKKKRKKKFSKIFDDISSDIMADFFLSSHFVTRPNVLLSGAW
jgi:hypothetical protein